MNILFWLLIWIIIAVSGGGILSVFLKKSDDKVTEIYEAKHAAEFIYENKIKQAMLTLEALRKNRFVHNNQIIEARELMWQLENLERSIFDAKAKLLTTASSANLRSKAEKDVVIGFILPQPE